MSLPYAASKARPRRYAEGLPNVYFCFKKVLMTRFFPSVGSVPKRQWLLFGALVVAVGAVLFLFWVRRPYSPAHAVSPQAAVVLWAPRGMREAEVLFAQSNNALLSSVRLPERYRDEVRSAAALLTPEVAYSWANEAHLAAFSLHPNDSLRPLLALDVGQAAEVRHLLAEPEHWSEYRFRGHAVYEYRGSARWVVAVWRNVLLVSRFSYLVEEALVALARRDDWWVEHLARVEAPLVSVVRLSALAARAPSALKTGWLGLAEALSATAEAIVIGLHSDSSEVVVRTVQAAAPGPALGREPLAAVLPDHAVLCSWLTGDQPGEALSAFLQLDGPVEDFKRYVLPWCGREAALVWLEPQAGSTGLECAWVCATTDESRARRSLDEYGARSGFLRRYRYHAFEIRQFLDPSLLRPLLFAGTEPLFANPACTFIEGYAVFAPSTAALEVWLDKYIVSQTLANDLGYLSLLARQGKTGRWVLWANTRHWPLLLEKVLTPATYGRISHELRPLSALGWMGLDLKPQGKREWRGILLHQPPGAAASASSLMWKTSLPAKVIGAPQIIEPATEDAIPLVLVQDAQGRLHCIEPGGRLRWSKNVRLPLQSRIGVLDELSPGQRYYAFNTAEALWMLDENGREVLGFPLRLQSPATNGLLAVSLTSAHRYGLFVACANGNLYGFDAYGRPLPGWNPKSGAGVVVHPMLHFTWSDRDYFVALDTQGRLTCVDRLGNDHFAPSQLPGSFKVNPPQYVMMNGTPHILCINDGGKVVSCSTTGHFTRYPLGWDARQPHSGIALSSPVSEHRPHIAIAQGLRLNVFALSHPKPTLLHRRNLPAPADTLWMAGEMGIGTLSVASRLIFLFDRNGYLLKGFPLGGTTPFALSAANPQEPWIAVGYDTEVYAYRLFGQ